MKPVLLSLLFILSFSLFSQEIYFDNTVPPDEMIMDFFNTDSLTVSNVEFSDTPFSIAFFDSGDTPLEVNAGLVFTTGMFWDLPNHAQVFASTDNNGLDYTDNDIALASGYGSNFDNTFVQFEIQSDVDRTFDFNYVFGSEEYPEFVGSTFNDAFLFLVSGPGINGVYSNNSKNTAMIPNSNDAVTINSLNMDANQEFYIDNEFGEYLVLDGHTTLLPATFDVQANETYLIKVIVSDVSDNIFDSAIFLGYNSLGNPDSLVPPTDFTFLQNGNTIEFMNHSKYATNYEWDFGNGETSSSRFPQAVSYDTPGNYTVQLTTTNYCCTNTFTTEISIGTSSLTLEAEVVQDVLCNGGNDGIITINASGGNGPYTITAVPEISDYNALFAGEYVIQVVDQDGQTAQQLISISEPTAIVVAESITDSDDGMNNGAIYNEVTGGIEPYSFLWSNGETSEDIENLPSGDYTLTITDGNGCIEIRNYTVTTIFAALQASINIIQHVSCYEGDDGQANLTVIGGNGPYEYYFTPAGISLSQLIAGEYSFQIVDQDGQEVFGDFIITEPTELDISTTVIGSTDNNDNGSITIDASGGTAPYTYLWSNGETTEEIVDLAPGEYTVTITDSNSCVKIETVTVEQLVNLFEENIGQLQLYPNPAVDFIVISELTIEIEKLSIINMDGKIFQLPYTINADNVSIDLHTIIPGIYTMNILSSKGKRFTGNFIKTE